jgi:release factor glutamine methyltransferase
MISISDFKKKYSKKINSLDLELLIAAAINQPREFVLTYPEYKIPATCNLKLEAFLRKRLKNEPIAYILGQKEFYGLEFKVDKNTLIPRPETEQLVELVSRNMKHGTWNNKKNKLMVADIGTGSGNIIISLVKNLMNSSFVVSRSSFYAIDISSKALAVAQQNAKFHRVNKKINFLKGNLLEPLIKKCLMSHVSCSMIIVANLPYLSSKIYSKVSLDIKNYEPKIALYSPEAGLAHYKEFFKQLKTLRVSNCKLQIFLEISPEQKNQLKKVLQITFPNIHPTFFKDLSGKFRVIQIEL